MSTLASLVESPVATRQDVSRLFARAAFGATAQDLDTWNGRPYAEVVDNLLNVPALDGRPPAPDEAERLAFENDPAENATQGADFGLTPYFDPAVEKAGRWWVERMRTTQYPLEERMTLLWHDHFATAFGFPYPDVRMLMQQNQTLRRRALGNFRTLVEEISVDPAMLYWLNGNENAKGAPNENYGRELLELFTLGVIPQVYTEQDIREAARALTGWLVEPLNKAVSFSAGRHDTGQKTVLGTTFGNLGAEEYKKVVEIALAQDAAPKFVAYKMVVNFAYEPPTGDLFQDPEPLVDKVAATLRSSNWDLKEGMRTLLMADEFRFADPAAARQVVRQPIDLAATACKQIGVSAKSSNVSALLRRMGQLPFEPPNVGGWPRSKEWLSPVTTLARYDWGVTVYNLFSNVASINGTSVGTSLLTPLPQAGDLDGWAKRFGLAELSANTKSLIQDYLAARAGAPDAERRAGVLILLASSPDWMVM